MNLALVARLLSIIAVLIAGTMAFSLPWAFKALNDYGFERGGFFGLLGSMVVSLAVAGMLWMAGRDSSGHLYRKEAMAVVGLSWVLATVLGALPYLLSGTEYAAGQRMNVADALFESQSGFSTTGATVLTQLENFQMVPRSILFWRSSTHFLGGLGIIVLFVAILGQGSAGKALMRAEMPGPTSDSSQARMQQTAWAFASIYAALTLILTVILHLEGMIWFDALCHAFGTMATGGFSTKNASIGYYNSVPIDMTIVVFMILAGTNFALLYVLVSFRWRPVERLRRVLGNVELRVYLAIIVGVTLLVVGFGHFHQDFTPRNLTAGLSGPGEDLGPGRWKDLPQAIRYGLFQVVSILTTTGYTTHDFDSWNSFGRGILFLIMFIGGCAGSTGGGLKVIRHVLFLKILGHETERSFHPNVVRPLRLGGQVIDDPDLRRNILVYFALILVIFVFSWMALVTIEPDATWTANGQPVGNKLIDSASGVAATLNNIGPGLGTVGAKENYSQFSAPSKLLFTWLMMIGRLEIFVILVLFLPGFWRVR